MKKLEMLVLSLGGVNHGFKSHSKITRPYAIVISFRIPPNDNEKDFLFSMVFLGLNKIRATPSMIYLSTWESPGVYFLIPMNLTLNRSID